MVGEQAAHPVRERIEGAGVHCLLHPPGYTPRLRIVGRCRTEF